jgi:hypothetical protein
MYFSSSIRSGHLHKMILYIKRWCYGFWILNVFQRLMCWRLGFSAGSSVQRGFGKWLDHESSIEILRDDGNFRRWSLIRLNMSLGICPGREYFVLSSPHSSLSALCPSWDKPVYPNTSSRSWCSASSWAQKQGSKITMEWSLWNLVLSQNKPFLF